MRQHALSQRSRGHGGTTVLRQAVFAGPTSGTFRLITVYEDAAARAAALDAMSQDGSVPMRDFLASADPGAVGLGRAMLNSVGNPPPDGTGGAVNLTFIFRPLPGHQAELLEAIPESQDRIAAHGATASAWQTFAAGPASGSIILGISADSMTALQSAMDATVAEGPSSLVTLLQGGAAEPLGSTISVRVDL